MGVCNENKLTQEKTLSWEEKDRQKHVVNREREGEGDNMYLSKGERNSHK